MTKVYVLQHVHSLEDGEEDVKFIGVYSSRENAEAAITRLRRAPGFSTRRTGFTSTNTRLIRTNGWKGIRPGPARTLGRRGKMGVAHRPLSIGQLRGTSLST